MSEQLRAGQLDQIIDVATSIELKIPDKVIIVDTPLMKYRFEITEDDVHPVIATILTHINTESYDKKTKDILIELCTYACETKINNIIKDSVLLGEKITPVVMECCAELFATMVKVDPIMMMHEGSDLAYAAFKSIYGSVVNKMNKLREELK